MIHIGGGQSWLGENRSKCDGTKVLGKNQLFCQFIALIGFLMALIHGITRPINGGGGGWVADDGGPGDTQPLSCREIEK